ncbi:MAG: hypothetical protein RR426_08170 [Oscillospiraceae bacterium]
MAWDYALAEELHRLSKGAGAPALLEGTVISTAPLTFSLYGGELMAPPLPLRLTAAAPGYDLRDHSLSLHPWQVGDHAVCTLLGKALVVLGRLL